MARNLKPVSIAGIEGDALISEDISYSADIPEYPVENGYNVSDTIILKPIQLSITLYISDSPATWRNRKGHSPSAGRTKKICEKFEKLYFQRKLVKVVTTDKIYTSMGITSMSISHSSEIGYARQIQFSLKKVYINIFCRVENRRRVQEKRQRHPVVQNLRVLRQANLEALINPEALASRVVERRALYYITSGKKQDFCRRWVNAIYYSSGYER